MEASGTSHKTLLHLAIIILLGTAVYSNTLGAPFIFDDTETIVGNPMIRDVSNIPRFFMGGKWSFASRPLVHATNAMNYYFGALNPTGYHVVNIAVHILNGILLYFLVLMTGRRLGAGENETRIAAALSAVLFVVHPVQAEAVTNIINRSTLLAATFCFLGLILFIKAVDSKERRWLFGAGLFLASMLGMASRENFATFPLILFLYDMFFVSRFRLREAAARYGLYIAAAAPLAYLAFLAHNNTYSLVTPTLAGLTPYKYVLTELKVHWTYLRLLALPINQTLDYDFPNSAGILETSTALSTAGYLGLLSFCALAARRRPVAAFGVLWFLIILTPISFGVAFLKLKLDDVIFEHRIYLPGAGIIVALSCGATMLLALYNRARTALVATGTALIVVLSSAAYARNHQWQNELRLWQDVISKAPNKVRGYINMGFSLEKYGRPENAIEYYLRALEPQMSPAPAYYMARVHFNLAGAYEKTGHLEKEMEHTAIGIVLNQPVENSFSSAGDYYLKKGSLDKAIEHYRRAIVQDPGFADAHFGLGNAYAAKGLGDEAVRQYQESLRLNPENARAHINLGVVYKSLGKLDEAIGEYSRAISINPNSADAHYNIANAYLQQGQVDKAIEHYELSIRLRPDDPAVHRNLAAAYRLAGMSVKADEHLRLAEGLKGK